MSESDNSSDGMVAPRQADLRDEVAVAMDIARRYYLQDKSKVAIAEEFNLSRFQVARLLREAREQGIVRIEIGAPLGRVDVDLSAAVKSLLGLRHAVVVATASQQSSTATVRQLGRALAQLLSETVTEGDIIGLGWSRVCDSMVDQLSKLERCTVVQLAGHLHRPGDTSGSVEAVRRAAMVSGGSGYPIYAPMIVERPEMAASLLRQPEIAEAIRLTDRLDRAVVSVGAWGARQSRLYDSVSAEVQQAGRDAGVCGEISGRLFDASGAAVPSVLDDRVIAISLDHLKSVPDVMATAWGAESATALRATVKARWVTTVVVDEDLAHALVD